MFQAINRLAIVAGVLGLAVGSQANILTQWNFNNESTTPNIGSGMINRIGGITQTWATGSPNDQGSPNRAYNTSGYPAQGTGSGTAGVEFWVSTVGYQDIFIKWDQRHSNTAAKTVLLQYTLNGNDWIDGAYYQATDGGDRWYKRAFDLSDVSGANDNMNFGFRVVAVFEQGTDQYAASTSGSTYSPNGTQRFDLVTVEATEIPEPATLLALGTGLAAVVGRRLRRK